MSRQNLKEDIKSLVNSKLEREREHRLSGSGLDSKRPAAWCEYGFKENLTDEDFYKAYDRTSLGNAAVEIRASTVWSTDPKVIFGTEADDSGSKSSFEIKMDRMAEKTYLWDAMTYCDKFRMISGWSAMILTIADGDRIDQPVTKSVSIESLISVTPVYSSQLTIESQDEHGIVTMYNYMQPSINGTGGVSKRVHPDRVIIVGNQNFSRSILKAGFNELVTIEKVTGGSGESFLKNASRAVTLNFGKDTDFEQIAMMHGSDISELPEMFNEVARDLNVGLDTVMALQDTDAKVLSVQVSDPMPTYNVALQQFSASVTTPSMVLIGAITGERASTEDLKRWHSTCQSWRVKESSRSIRSLVDRMIQLKMIDPVKYSVIWDDLRESTPSDKVEYANKVADIVQKFSNAKQQASLLGDDLVISEEEIRDLLGYNER